VFVFSLDKYGALKVQYVTEEKIFLLAVIIRVNTALRQLFAGVQRPLLWFTCLYSLHSALGSVESLEVLCCGLSEGRHVQMAWLWCRGGEVKWVGYQGVCWTYCMAGKGRS
jgi:hypothetical protein